MQSAEKTERQRMITQSLPFLSVDENSVSRIRRKVGRPNGSTSRFSKSGSECPDTQRPSLLSLTAAHGSLTSRRESLYDPGLVGSRGPRRESLVYFNDELPLALRYSRRRSKVSFRTEEPISEADSVGIFFLRCTTPTIAWSVWSLSFWSGGFCWTSASGIASIILSLIPHESISVSNMVYFHGVDELNFSHFSHYFEFHKAPIVSMGSQIACRSSAIECNWVLINFVWVWKHEIHGTVY